MNTVDNAGSDGSSQLDMTEKDKQFTVPQTLDSDDEESEFEESKLRKESLKFVVGPEQQPVIVKNKSSPSIGAKGTKKSQFVNCYLSSKKSPQMRDSMKNSIDKL